MDSADFEALEQFLRELAYMDDDLDSHQQHLQHLLDRVPLVKRIRYLRYLAIESSLRLNVIHEDRYENEAVVGPVASSHSYSARDAYRDYIFYELPASTIASTISRAENLLRTYVPARLKHESEKLNYVLAPLHLEGARREEGIVEQMTKANVRELLGYTSKYLDKLVRDGYLIQPVQRVAGGQWYFVKEDVLKFKSGEKHAEQLRERAASRLDDPSAESQKGLAPHKPPKRPARRKPPTQRGSDTD